MMQRRRGDDQIGLRESVPGFTPLLDHEPPPEHHVFRDLQHTLFEQRPYRVRQSVMRRRAVGRIGGAFDTGADFRERHRAHVKQIEWLASNESHHFWLRLRAAQLGQNIRIEKPARHKITSRTGMGARSGAMAISRWGEA